MGKLMNHGEKLRELERSYREIKWCKFGEKYPEILLEKHQENMRKF